MKTDKNDCSFFHNVQVPTKLFATNKFNQSSKPEMKGSTNNSACEL